MKSTTWILTVGAVMLASATSAQVDSTSPDLSQVMPVTEESSVTNDNVKRAVFTTGVIDREPVDELTSVPGDATRIWFFSEIVNLAGSTVTHRWIHGEETLAEVTFGIGGPRWRVYSSKILPPGRTGPWTVEIVDGDGNILHRSKLIHDDHPQEPAAIQDDAEQDG
jgi:hypothetical protein